MRISIYVPPDLHEKIKRAGINYSKVACDAYRRVLAEQCAGQAEYGPYVPPRRQGVCK